MYLARERKGYFRRILWIISCFLPLAGLEADMERLGAAAVGARTLHAPAPAAAAGTADDVYQSKTTLDFN